MASNTILIIEDDPVLRRGLVDNFRIQGYQVRAVADGRAGLAEAIQDPPDAIILDIMLPHVNGYEICRQVRQRGLQMPILMLSAKGQEREIIQGLDLGADDYITKPFSIRELIARVKAFLRRQTTTDSVIYRLGDAEFDTGSRKLTRGGVDVPLTSKEYGLLEYFVARRNRALTRNDIIDQVWGRSVIVTARSVDRCVTTLRSKLEPDPRNPTFIQTIRDFGYRFEFPWD